MRWLQCSRVCPGGWWEVSRTGNPMLWQNTGEWRSRSCAGPSLYTDIIIPVYHQTILASNVKQSRYGYYGHYYGNVNLYHVIGCFVNIAFIVKLNFLQRIVEVERKIFCLLSRFSQTKYFHFHFLPTVKILNVSNLKIFVSILVMLRETWWTVWSSTPLQSYVVVVRALL